VQLISVGGQVIAVDAEVITVVRAGRAGEVIEVADTIPARRVHAELCEGYRIADEREKRRRELAEYNQRNGRKTKGAL
jgi:hypothetical protein